MTPSVHLNTYVHLSKLFFRTKWNLQLINNWPNTIESKCPHKVMANLFKMYHRRHSEIANRYWPIRQPVLTNSPTGIDQFANRYWPIRQPVLAKSPTGIGQFANRYWPNQQPVLTKSPTIEPRNELAIWSIPVGVGVGIRIRFFFSLGNGLEKILILRGWTLSISDRIRNPCHERKKPQINYFPLYSVTPP